MVMEIFKFSCRVFRTWGLGKSFDFFSLSVFANKYRDTCQVATHQTPPDAAHVPHSGPVVLAVALCLVVEHALHAKPGDYFGANSRHWYL